VSAAAAPARQASRAHRIEFALTRALEAAVSALPERGADAAGRRLGRLAYALRLRRGVVEDNLRRAFPGADEAWIGRVARASYEHLGREAASMLRLARLDRAAVIERTDTREDWPRLEAALAGGRGVLLVTGHYGNWEIAAASVAARGVPIAAIVRRQGNPLFDARLDETRRRLGVETISQRDAPSRVPRLLRQNAVVGIVGDQDARRAGVFVPFFGRPASTHRGPALFSLRFGAPAFACVARRLPGEEVRYRVSGAAVEIERSGDIERDVVALTAALAARLEHEVRQAPEQYFWFHRRWKTRPPEPAAAAAGMLGPDADGSAASNERDDA
jgi:Kdo2-lipid IVA lauroyltransferase/acyltransferase